mmetsp:Transcript_5628/g.18851  ORF Transcript_5628/g.18851 Transcript_5628/m.18851 type:complete len:311 (-) Transcript_5628:794-1726(-)
MLSLGKLCHHAAFLRDAPPHSDDDVAAGPAPTAPPVPGVLLAVDASEREEWRAVGVAAADDEHYLLRMQEKLPWLCKAGGAAAPAEALLESLLATAASPALCAERHVSQEEVLKLSLDVAHKSAWRGRGGPPRPPPPPPQSASVAQRLLCSVLPPPLRRPRRAASDAAAAPLLLPRRAIVEDATGARSAILQQQAALAAAAAPRPLPRALLLPRRRHRPVGKHSTRVPAFAPAFGRRGVASRCVPLLGRLARVRHRRLRRSGVRAEVAYARLGDARELQLRREGAGAELPAPRHIDPHAQVARLGPAAKV